MAIKKSWLNRFIYRFLKNKCVFLFELKKSMVRFVLFLLIILFPYLIFSQNRKGVTPPTKEYVTHLKAAQSHGITHLKDKKVLNNYVSKGN